MPEPRTSVAFRRRARAESLLAKNMVAVRIAAGWTQDALSAASGISRATIAQLETGVSDPRLSTLAALAAALQLPLAVLLLGEVEIRALAGLGTGLANDPLVWSPAELRQLRRWVGSGMLRDRAEIVRLVTRRLTAMDGLDPLAVILAALFAPFDPDNGANVGAALGGLIAAESAKASVTPP